MESILKVGDKVTTSGYPGVVIRRYSPGMVEVRLESGVAAVSDSDCVPNTNPPGMDAFLQGGTRSYMEIRNRDAGLPCYCSSIWSGYCDFCSGLAPLDSQRAKDQREAQRPTHPAVAVRAIVKAACKTLSVRRGSGTAYCWTEIRGTGPDGFTEIEMAALKGLGLNPGGNFCCLDSKDAKAFIATTAAERRIGARFLVNGVHVPISGNVLPFNAEILAAR